MYGVGRRGEQRCRNFERALFSCTKRRPQSNSGGKTLGASKNTDVEPVKPAGSARSSRIWQRLGLLRKPLDSYGRIQDSRPYATQIVTSMIIYFCGDLGAQKIGGDAYDPWRTARNMIIGATVSIPAYNWFMYLGRSFNYRSKLFSIGTKVVINQIVFTPIFLSTFFGMQTLLSGDGPAEAADRIRRTLPASFVNALKLWPAVTAFSFTYIAPQYRALFAGGIAIFWQAYLSWLNERAEKEEKMAQS